MKKRGEKSIKELYSLAEKIPNPEITPVLEGGCHIQGPVDESDLEFEGMSVGTLSVEKKYMVMKKSYCTRVESGTCNMCSAPCSSCMHFDRAMESNIDGGYTSAKLGRDETDCCSFNVADVHPIYKTRTCNDLQHAASESSNLLSVSSSHDSYSENAESKAALAPNATFDASDDIEMPSTFFLGEAGGKDGVLPKVTSVSTHRQPSSSSYSAAVLHQMPFTDQNEEQHQIECHEDSSSCLTGGSDANGAVNLLNADVDRKKTTHSVMVTKNVVAGVKTEPGVEINEDEIKPLQPSACLNELSQKRSLGSCTLSSELSSKSDFMDVSALKVNSSKGELSEYLMEKVEFSVGEPMAPASMEGAMPTSHSGSKACQIKAKFSSGAIESNYPCLETEICKETENTPNEGLEDDQCGARTEPSEKLITPMEISKIQGPEKQHQQTNEREHSVSDIEDVKVCDICGDAGREECLAICSRCSDGAEHIYCMRIMMEKVPEGEWLCEECKLKEDAENKKVDKTEELPAVSKFPSIKDNENSERTSNIILLPKLETEAADLEVKRVLKGSQSPKFSTKKHDDNLEVFSMNNNKRLSESNAGPMASPRKRVALSRESSFKNADAEKANPAKTGPCVRNQAVHSPKAFGQTQTSSGANPSKNQTQLQTSRGSLSRSLSFNYSGAKGKVKQLIEKIPSKLKNPKELSPIDVRKVGVIRTMSKNASFRSLGSGRPGAESPIKIQSVNSHRAEDSRGFKHLKEINSLEKKNSFKLGHNVASPSSISNTGIPLKAELKASHYDGKLNNMSETNKPAVDKGFGDSDDTGCNEAKKQSLNTWESFGNQSSNNSSPESQKSNMFPSKEGIRSCVDSSNIHTEAVPFRSLPQAAESSLQDEKKDSHFLSGSRQVGATSCRIAHCQRCNETGHATQQCSINKFRVSALKPSAEHNSKEWTSKNCKWKAAVEAVVSKTKMRRNIRSLDQPQESTVASEVESRNLSPNCSSSVKNLTNLESTSDEQEVFRNSDASPSRTANASDVKQQGIHLVEDSIRGSRESDIIISNLEELTVKSLGQMRPHCASAFEDPLRVSAIPEFEYIWQGDFEVVGSIRGPEPFNGVQAHLSTSASPKVLEVVTKFPGKVKLEEVCSGNTWPLQFLRTGPKEDNIALFFFAKDVESYEKNYKKLVETMLKNDLALRGIIDGVELFIFPSNKLPEKSQRWNNLFFLWGVFRERSIDCLNSLPTLPKPCKSSYEMEPLVSGSVYPVAPEVTISKIELHEIPEKTLPKLEIWQQVKAAEPRSDVDILPVSTSGNKDIIFQTQPPLLIQASGHTMGMLQRSIKSCADSRVQMNSSQLCLEQESVVTHVKHLSSDPEGRKGVGLQNNVQFSLSKHGALPSLPIHWISKNGREGSECGFRNKEMREEILVKNEVVLGNDQHGLLPSTDHLSCEPKPLRKRVSSWLVEDTASQVSGETSMATDGTKLWKESLDLACVNNDRENKKMKLYAEGWAGSCSSMEEKMSGRLSSKVHPLLGSFPNERQHRDDIYSDVAESSRSAGRCLFPVDLNSVSGAEAEEVIHVLSSDDEDTPENNSPDLELALGGKKPPAKQEMLPLFFPLFDRRNNQNKMPADPGDDDVPASLSLSLGFPVPEKEQRAKQLLKTEQLLPERPCVNTSLLLFGGLSDT